MTRALLFDLDNTLIFEDEVTLRAVRAACERASGRVDPRALFETLTRTAERLWRDAPTHAYADAMGMWWGEGLWGEFRGPGEGLGALREFAPAFRQRAWQDALAACGADDPSLVAELVDAYRTARRAGELVDPQAAALLEDVGRDHRCALVTNGAPDVQREKLERTTLSRHFGAIVISAEVGIGKPDARIFTIALDAIGAGAAEAVMIGDSLSRDVAGAHSAGLRAIWIDRGGAPPRPGEPTPDARIAELSELRSTLAALAPAGASPRGSL